jgi:hypothetical protein
MILASNDFPGEIPPRIGVVNNPNHTVKPVKQDHVEPQRIVRPSTPDAGRSRSIFLFEMEFFVFDA